MSLYVIGYDLHPTRGETYGDLIDAIKNLSGTWWHSLDSTWLVVSAKSAADIRDVLWHHMKSDDQLLVAKLSGELAWNGFDQESADWLRTHYND